MFLPFSFLFLFLVVAAPCEPFPAILSSFCGGSSFESLLGARTFLGAPWGPLEASWAPSGGLWWLPRAALLRTRVSLNDWVAIWSASGGVLGPSWAVMGISWGHIGALLGRLGALLDCLEARLGGFGTIFGASRAVSDARKTEEPSSQ